MAVDYSDLESVSRRLLVDYLAGAPATGVGAAWTWSPVALANHTPRGTVTAPGFDPNIDAHVAPFTADDVRRRLGYIAPNLLTLTDGDQVPGRGHDGVNDFARIRAQLTFSVAIVLPIAQRETYAIALAGELRDLMVGFQTTSATPPFYLRQRRSVGDFRLYGGDENDDATTRTWFLDCGIERESVEILQGHQTITLQPFA
ncbi:MAG: hypothetical protein GY719_25900 [bacterium]|nr:hypothetical protein [bacterium]